MRRRTTAGISVLLVVGIAGLLGTMASTFPDALDRTTVSTPTVGSPALNSRVVMIIIGSLRMDASQDPSLMPRLSAARQHGSWGIVQTSPIPISAAFIWAFTMGRPFTPLDIFHDFYPYRVPAHSTIHLAVSAGRRVCLVGEQHLTSPFRNVVHRAEVVPFTSFRDMRTQDEEVFQRSSALIRSRSCELLILHLVNLDKAAHVYGGISARYREMAAGADAMLGALQDLSEPGTTFLVISDHGTNDDGDHAVPEPIVRNPPFVLWGTGVAQGISASIRQIDIGPLLAALLGFPIPPNSLGTIPMELLSGPASTREAILARAIEQKENYLRAYARQQEHPQIAGTLDQIGRGHPAKPGDENQAESKAITTLRRLDTLYWTDLQGRAAYRMALGATIGAILLSFLGFALCQRGLEPSGVPAGASTAPECAIGLATMITMVVLLSARLWEGGVAWGALALLTSLFLGIVAVKVQGGCVQVRSPLAIIALLIWGVASIIPAWWPQFSMQGQLPGFRPAFLFRQPLWVGLTVTGVGGFVALGFLRMRPANKTLVALAAMPVLSLTLTYTTSLFHDLVHWALGVIAAAALWLIVLRRRVSRSTIMAIAGLLTVLAIRRIRGLTFTGALAEVWWAPPLVLGIACVVLLRPTLWPLHPPSPADRTRAKERSTFFGLSLLALLTFIGAIRHLDLQQLSRWLHPALFGLVAAACFLTRDRTLRLSVTFGAFIASSYLLFDLYGFLAMVASLGFLLALWPTRLMPQNRWSPWVAGLLYFSAVWLLFFATGNEFDLTAVNALRKGMLGSDIGGAGGFSLGWTILLIFLKLTYIHLLPLLALASATSRPGIAFDWAGFLVTGATLHFTLFLGFFVRYTTVGYSATGGILVSAVSLLIFLAAYPIHRLAASDDENGRHETAQPPPVSRPSLSDLLEADPPPAGSGVSTKPPTSGTGRPGAAEE